MDSGGSCSSAWFWKVEKEEAAISDDDLLQKARQLSRDGRLCDATVSEFWNGWLENFKRRNGIHSMLLQGEGGLVSMEAAEAAKANLQSILSDYELKKIYNMDETGLFLLDVTSKDVRDEDQKGNQKGQGESHPHPLFICRRIR